MDIYIASSWRNQHAVEMLTDRLRERGHRVQSFVEYDSGYSTDLSNKGFNHWVNGEGGRKTFEYDSKSAMSANLVIYIGPSGCDAWAEVGLAYAAGVKVIGLSGKGEQIGVMRYLVSEWFDDYRTLLIACPPDIGKVMEPNAEMKETDDPEPSCVNCNKDTPALCVGPGPRDLRAPACSWWEKKHPNPEGENHG